MSQQEFVPRPQEQQSSSSQEDQEFYYPQHPYNWSGNLDAQAEPRDVPPSSYSEAPGQEEYQERDYAAGLPPRGRIVDALPSSQSQRQQGSARSNSTYDPNDGDAFEQGYRPFSTPNSRYSVPPWARPQRHRRGPLRFGFMILALVLIGLTLSFLGMTGGIFGGLGDVLGAIIGVIFALIAGPIILLLIIFGIAWRALFLPVRMRQRHRARYWRGPWWM